MKPQELRDLTMDELKQKLEDFHEELFNLRFQLAMNRLDNSSKISLTKRDIARVNTIITEKKNAEQG